MMLTHTSAALALFGSGPREGPGCPVEVVPEPVSAPGVKRDLGLEPMAWVHPCRPAKPYRPGRERRVSCPVPSGLSGRPIRGHGNVLPSSPHTGECNCMSSLRLTSLTLNIRLLGNETILDC